MSIFKIDTTTYLKLVQNLSRLTRGDSSSVCKVEIENNLLNIYYKNKPEKGLIDVSYLESYQIESQISCSFFITISELTSVKIPSASQNGFPKVETLTLDLSDANYVNLSYNVHWKPESKPSFTSLKLLYCEADKNVEQLLKYNDFSFTKEFKINAQKLKSLLSVINIYSSDATSKIANNILLKVKNNKLIALSTDSSTAAKYITDLENTSNSEFDVAVPPVALKLCELFLGKSEDFCTFTIKHNKFFLKLNNSLMIFPISSNIEDLLLYLDLFNDLPKVKGEISLKPFSDSVRVLINNSKENFFKLKISGTKNLLNLSSSSGDGVIQNLPAKLNSKLDGLIDAYLLTNIITKVKNEDVVNILYDSDKNIWCIKLKDVDLTFLIQGMS